jgi:hypothetical protein
MMWYPLSILFFLNYGKTTPETFLIPSDFRGQFRVVYGEKCGINPPIENGRRILQIPNDGILIIRPEFEYGWIDHEYDFVDKNGKRIKIQSTSDTIKNKSLPNIIFAGNGNVPGKMPDGSFSSESPLTYEYVDFVVTYKDIIYNESTKETQRFDSICKALIDSCRASKN